jgi:hypothetical protein
MISVGTEDALRTTLNQTIQFFEIIVVNDGKKDNGSETFAYAIRLGSPTAYISGCRRAGVISLAILDLHNRQGIGWSMEE